MESELLQRTRERLAAYYEAEKAILEGQSYTIGSRSLTRANLAWVKGQIDALENKVEGLKAQSSGRGRRRAYRITPRDL